MTPVPSMTSPQVATVRFGYLWTTMFFLVSRDKNWRLHLPAPFGQGIVQGLAINAMLGSTVSTCFPGLMVAKIGEMKFVRMTRIGESLEISFTNVRSRGSFTSTDVTIMDKDGGIVVKTSLVLRKQ